MSSSTDCAIAVVLAAMLPASAAASPTYLECAFKEGRKTAVLTVAADEASGSVTTLSEASGYSERRSAVFTPTSVRWASPSPAGGLRYDISRTKLTIVRDLVVGSKTISDRGICKLQTAPKRAF